MTMQEKINQLLKLREEARLGGGRRELRSNTLRGNLQQEREY